MVVVIRMAAHGEGFDVHAPEEFEEHDAFNVATHEEALKVAARIAVIHEEHTGEPAEISDEATCLF